MSKIFYIPTAIVVGLIGSYIGTIHCHCKLRKLTQNLNTAQLEFYKNARQRRLYYFMTGIVIAIIGAILFLCLSPSILYHRIMNALIILLLTPMIVYTLYPKSPYMLQQSNINNEETSTKTQNNTYILTDRNTNQLNERVNKRTYIHTDIQKETHNNNERKTNRNKTNTSTHY